MLLGELKVDFAKGIPGIGGKETMEICKIAIFFPIRKLDIKVIHFTSRRPTVIEQYVFELICEIGKFPEYRNIPIGRLFGEFLCVPSPEVFVGPAFDLVCDQRARGSN